MLLALTSAFALSQSYRSVAALMAAPLQGDFGLSAQALGLADRGVFLAQGFLGLGRHFRAGLAADLGAGARAARPRLRRIPVPYGSSKKFTDFFV